MNTGTAPSRDDPKRTTPTALMKYAQDFHDAAIVVFEEFIERWPAYKEIAPGPAVYLIGHSMELSLKAFLLQKGATHAQLKRKFGHNLDKCLNEAKRLGLPNAVTFDEQELTAFAALDALYSIKDLEYIYRESKTFPIFGYIQTMSQKLLSSIGPIVNSARMAQ